MRRREDPTNGIEIVSAPFAESDYVVAGQKIKTIGGEQVAVPKSEKEIIQEVRRSLPQHYWMLQNGYNDRKPHDAWEITVDGHTVPLFNYAEGVDISESHVQKITVHMALFAMHFAEYMPQLGAITITDHFPENLTNDGIFKRHAEAQPAAEMFALTPRTLEQGVYRPDLPVERIGAVILHELAHFDMDEAPFSAEWPEDRVTAYAATFGVTEDIPDSAAAYLLGVGHLSTEKRDILARHDHWLSRPDMLYAHAPDLPPPEAPDVIRYHVDTESVEDPLAE